MTQSMLNVAYNSGRRAFMKGWSVCIFKPFELQAAWKAGYQDEQDELCELMREQRR